MNLPASSTRGFFEILVPGICLILNVFITGYFIAATLIPSLTPEIERIFANFTNPAVIIALLVVLGYPVGIVLRLLKSTNIDKLSARYIIFLRPKRRNELYLKDVFFYGNWMREKVIARLPAEAALFYDEYWADKDTGDASKNTTFFNFCKILIAKVDPQSGIEIYAAEALTRFVAGSYYALQISTLLMLINTYIAATRLSWQIAALPLTVTVGYLYLLHVILSQYRLFRAKEVDTVFNACFANREHFDKLFPTVPGRKLLSSSKDTAYELRKNLLLTAWGGKPANSRVIQSLDYERLIDLMKTESRLHPYLSSLYFAGSDIDHPYFLENNKIAIGLAVLPEDAEKAGSPKRHPNQTEIIIVMDGSLCLHLEDNGQVTDKLLNQFDYFVITDGACHWVTSNDSSEAVYLFIKTNPAQEPRGIPCAENIE